MKSKNKTLPKWLFVSLTGCMLTLPQSVWGQGKTITGSVIDADDGSPLMGATITVAGSKDGTITDMDGNFKMTVNGQPHHLSVSYLGYDTQQVTVTNGTIVVKLRSSQRSLNEVVVVDGVIGQVDPAGAAEGARLRGGGLPGEPPAEPVEEGHGGSFLW